MVEQTTGSTNSEIVYGPGGGKLALMNGTPLIKAFVPLTGGATAVYTSSGLAAYRHTDHLGSSRLSSTPTNTVYSDTAYSAFGEPYAQSGALDPSFTGQNQDTTAGLYDFLFREQDPNQGRWASPDLAGLAAVDITNPQSWNRYAYVLNSPTNLIDPLGQDDCNIWNVSYEGSGSTFPCPDQANGGFPFPDLGPSNPALTGGCSAEYQSCTTLPDGTVLAQTGSTTGYYFYRGYFEDSRTGWAWFWTPVTITVGNPGSTLDDRANALAGAINRTGVQAINNPCTVAAWYGASAVGAVLFSATGAGAAVFPATNKTIKMLGVLYRLAPPGIQLLVRNTAASLIGAASYVPVVCNSLQ